MDETSGERRRPVTDDQWLDEAGITDPELRVLAVELGAEMSEIGKRLDDFADSLVDADAVAEPVITRDMLCDTIEGLLGDDYDDDFREAAAIFTSLRANRPETGEASPLQKGLMFHTNQLIVPLESRKIKRRYDPHIRKSQTVGDYWAEAAAADKPLLLDVSERAGIRQNIVEPIMAVQLQQGDSDDPRQNRMDLREAIHKAMSIQPDISLDELKMVIGTELVKSFGSPAIARTLAKYYVDNGWHEQVGHPFSAAIYSCDLIDALELEDETMVSGYVSLITKQHVKERLFKTPSKEFKHTMHNIRALGALYRSVVRAEAALKELPVKQQKYTELYNEWTGIEFSSIIGAANKAMQTRKRQMINHVNSQIGTAANQEEINQLWRQAHVFNTMTSGFAELLEARVKEVPAVLIDSTRDELLDHKRNNVAQQLQNQAEQRKLAKLEPEINERLEQLGEIDGYYQLSNSKMRDRDPQLIGLAKILSDSLKNSDPISVESLRAAVALMRGIYHERTGVDADLEQLVGCYLADAKQLRQLSLELDYLGRPTSSKFLGMINMLDELIDAGVFDDMKGKPELKPFEDFLLTYVLLRDSHAEAEVAGEPEVEEPTETPVEEERSPGLPVPALPVEVIGVAEYEDLKVFPPSANTNDIIHDYTEHIGEKDMPSIEWERISKFVELRDKLVQQKLEVNFIRTKHASWQVLPFFVLEIKLPNTENAVAVLESPVHGNATYIYREGDDRFEWRDVVELGREEARNDHGAIAKVHVADMSLEKHFTKVWNEVISELTIHQPVSTKV